MVIGELYPQACEHLDAARQAKSDMAALWGGLLAGGLVDTAVATNSDGTGRITAFADWPTGSRQMLTDSFAKCVNESWACLDSLICESVTMFSVRQRPRTPERPRFFPIADSAEGLHALLAESCMDCVLRVQSAMVIDCQPFRGVHDDARIQRFRTGLQFLLTWTHCLEQGAQISAWITPFEPQLHVTPPVRLECLNLAPAGELANERDVARYTLTGYQSGAPVSGQAGSYVDLGFADGSPPETDDDTFDRRSAWSLMW